MIKKPTTYRDISLNTNTPLSDSDFRKLLKLKTDKILELIDKYGWVIFPVFGTWSNPKACLCQNPNCGSIGKHPIVNDWKTAASGDKTQITLWAQASYGCNWGLPTGSINDIFFLDADDGNGKRGLEALEELENKYGPLPNTLTIRTPHGGLHIGFKCPKNPADIPKNRTNLRIDGVIAGWSGPSNIDIRGEGGYVVAPFSNIGTTAYTIVNDAPVAEAPQWLLSLLKTPTTHPTTEAVVSSWDSALAGLPYGERNNTLFRLAGDLCSKSIPLELALIFGNEVSIRANPPLDRAEVERTVRSAYNYSWGAEFQGFSSQELAERFYQMFSKRIRYNATLGKDNWIYLNDDNVWVQGRTAPYKQIHDVQAALKSELTRISDESVKKACRRAITSLKEPKGKDALLKEYRNQVGIGLTFDEMDIDPEHIALKNGQALNTTTCTVVPITPQMYFSQTTNIEYDPKAKAVRWKKFIKEIFPDPEVRTSIQTILGYLLLPGNPEQKLILFQGDGANGKSVLLNVLNHIFGDTAVTLQSNIFASSAKSAGFTSNHNADLAVARTALLVSTSETQDGDKMNEDVVKMMTGDEKLSARAPFAVKAVTYVPRFTPILATNNLPIVKGSNSAIWRRILVLDFTAHFPEGARDVYLTKKLIAESSGIFNWMLEGLKEYNTNGLNLSDKIKNAADTYKDENDLLKDFLDDCVLQDPNSWVPTENFLAAYVGYMYIIKQNSGITITANTLTRMLKNNNIGKPLRKFGTRGYSGIRLLQPKESAVNLTVLPNAESKITATFPTTNDPHKVSEFHDNNATFRHKKADLKVIDA